MKKIYFLFSFLFLFSGISFSQIVITKNDMPVAGDTLRTSITYTITNDYTLTGSNYTWDFSNLQPFNQKIDSFVSKSQTPLLYQIYFSNATLASPQPDISLIPNLPITDVFEFYKSSTASFSDLGYGVTVSGAPIPLKYDNPEIYYKFPLTYGNPMDSSLSSFSFGVPDLGYISTVRKRINVVDGWGTLTTPFGTFQTLRVKSEVYSHDSIYVDSLNYGTAIDRHITEYKWLGANQRIPLLQINSEGLITTVTYRDLPRNSSPSGYTVSGTVTYANTAGSPMSNVELSLKNSGGNIVATTTTDNSGNYSFEGIADGDYTIAPATSKPWGGVSATDVLLYKKHIANITQLTGIFLASGDVNASGNLSASDLLLIKKRIGAVINSFPTGDWLFDNVPFTVDGSNVSQNFHALVYGDANASYVPAFRK